ncbi:MAG: dTMP kinase [bacterium]
MGIFITLEGIDGSGKTTVSKILKDRLGIEGYRVALIKEPTETLLGKLIRSEILGAGKENPSFMKRLDGKTFAMAALFLFSADRTLHIDEINAKLNDSDIVICDRFIDSTYAYQAAELNCSDKDEELKDFILGVNEFILKQKNFAIDRTYIFDLEPEAAFNRLNGRADKLDGFDGRPPDFFNSVRNNYLYLSEKYKNRIKIIDASGMPENIAGEIADDIKGLAGSPL